LAAKQGVSADAIKQKWKHQAERIIDRRYRQPRFLNRRMKKCDVRNANKMRCNKNVAKRQRGDIRKILFEAEARLIRNMKGRKRNEIIEKSYSEEEIQDLMACVDFDEATINTDKWDEFFSGENRTPYTPKKNGERTAESKKQSLKKIATGPQAGRASMCKEHLQRRLELIRNGQTQSDEWNRINARSETNLLDAPPSLQQKIMRCVSTLEKILHRHGLTWADIGHFGIESARFDIAVLSSAEGRKFKKKISYSTSRKSDSKGLRDEQDNLCMKCGEELGGDTQIDHLFPKGRRGGNTALNRVVMHSWCNLQKWKGQLQPHAAAMEALKNNNSEKAAYIEKRLQKGFVIETSDGLAAPTQTMYGAKLLRAKIAEKADISLNEEKQLQKFFPHIRAAETAFFRKIWFPFMDMQKRSLRLKTRKKEWLEFRKDSEYGKAGEKLEIAEHDPIRNFNHALDAIVLAANIDWQKIARLEADIANNSKDRAKRLHEAHRTKDGRIAPLLDSNKQNPAGIWCAEINDWKAPPHGDWLVQDKKSKEKITVAKSKREPVRRQTNADNQYIATQRQRLDKLARKDVDKIIDAKIRDAMKQAFEHCDTHKLTIAKGKPKEDTVPDSYFLSLDKNHILHPHKTRSARIELTGATKGPNLFAIERRDRKRRHIHYFGKENPWSRTHLYAVQGEKKTVILRETDSFYWRGKRDGNSAIPPLNQRYENDAQPPQNGEEIGVFAKGDHVCIKGEEPTVWRVTKLEKARAGLVNPQHPTSRGKAYSKLKKIK
jgi:hypothetical protein